MTDETKNQDNNTDDKAEEIRKQVESRVHAAGIKSSLAGGNGRPKVSSSFVRKCLRSNELGEGLLYAALHRNHFIYNNATKEWFNWIGHHWDRDILNMSLANIETVVNRLVEEAAKISDEITWQNKKGDDQAVKHLQNTLGMIYSRISRLRTDRGRNNCLKFARTNFDPLALRGDEFDLNPWLLPCTNGVIDLRTGNFRDGRPTEYMYLACPTEWQGLKAPCSRWKKFLLEIHNGKKEMVDYMQRLLGYSILGTNIEHIFPVLYGPGGRNGKSKLVEALNFTLGPIAGPIQSELLLDQGRARTSQGPSPDIMALKGLRIAFASETDEGRRFSSATVKWLTGGDKLVGRYPHDKYNIHFKPTHTLFLLTNRKPSAPGDDHAFWERMHLIPFRLSFVTRKPVKDHERRADIHIGEKLQEEAPGILAWLVRGCLDYQKDGLNPPLEIIEATAEYRRNEDILADWLEDYCDVGPDEKGQASDLYDHFAKWFKQNVSRKKAFSQRRFGTLLGRQFEKVKIEGTVFYIGVDLDPAAPPLSGED